MNIRDAMNANFSSYLTFRFHKRLAMAKPVDHATEGWVHCGRIDKAAESKHDGGRLFSIDVASCVPSVPML